jgi:hypothetical protein
MSASNDELLLNAARDGDLEKVKDLLSKVTVTEFKDVVSKIYFYPSSINYYLFTIILLMIVFMMPLCVASIKSQSYKKIMYIIIIIFWMLKLKIYNDF